MQETISNDIMFDRTMQDFFNESNKKTTDQPVGKTAALVQKEKIDEENKKIFNYNSLVRTHRDYQRESIEKLKRHEDDMMVYLASKDPSKQSRNRDLQYGQSYKTSQKLRKQSFFTNSASKSPLISGLNPFVNAFMIGLSYAAAAYFVAVFTGGPLNPCIAIMQSFYQRNYIKFNNQFLRYFQWNTSFDLTNEVRASTTFSKPYL